MFNIFYELKTSLVRSRRVLLFTIRIVCFCWLSNFFKLVLFAIAYDKFA